MNMLWKIFAALAVAALGVTLWFWQKAGGMPLLALFLDSSPIVVLVEILLVPALLLAAALPNGRGQTRGFMLVLLWLGLGLGALVALQRLLLIREIAERTHTTNLQIVAPSVAESLVPLVLGLLIAAIAAWKVASAKPPSPAASFD